MKRRKRQAASESANERKAIRQEAARHAEEAKKAREDRLREALARSKTNEHNIIDTALADERGRSPLLRKLRGVEITERAKLVLQVASSKAPRLLTPDYVPALNWLGHVEWVRPIEEWEPQGKGRDTVFRSLGEHLLSKYPTPHFIWNAFFEPDAPKLAPIVAFMAGGGSLFKASKTGTFPIKLTRSMVHEVVTSTSGTSFMGAVRKAQIKASDGTPRLHTVWMGTDVGKRLHETNDEEFWATVLAWLSRNPMLDPHQIGPLIDFIAFRRGEDATFSMKGRTVLALLRGMREWHGDLAKEKAIIGETFEKSEFKDGVYERDYTRNKKKIHEEWKVTEITSSKRLAAEGREMRHCVYSYARTIASGIKSIWSMTRDGERELTIEVTNGSYSITQAQGKTNKPASTDQHRILVRWANENSLDISLGRW